MIECIRCGGSPIEYDGLCASCRSDDRKAARIAAKPVKAPQWTKKVSDKRQDQNKEYLKERLKFLKANPICQVCEKSKSTEVHHKKGRTNDMLLKTEFWLAVCSRDHIFIEMKPDWARENDYTLSRLTP